MDSAAPLHLAPSILSADFARLLEDSEKVAATADWLHVDVMDGHFVPNLTFGALVVQALHGRATLPMDCHLMIEHPERWVLDYVKAGAASVTFHVEATADPAAVAAQIREAGARAGIALKPGTPLEPYLPLLAQIDLLLIMTVEPGFGGQSFMPEMLAKVRQARAYIAEHGLDTWIQVDGGVSEQTIAACAQAGANNFVAGSAVYHTENPGRTVAHLRALAQAARG